MNTYLSIIFTFQVSDILKTNYGLQQVGALKVSTLADAQCNKFVACLLLHSQSETNSLGVQCKANVSYRQHSVC